MDRYQSYFKESEIQLGKRIGSGQSRQVFTDPNDPSLVIKKAHQAFNIAFGIKANKREVELWTSTHSFVLCPVVSYDENFKWLRMIKCHPYESAGPGNKKFKAYTGITFVEFSKMIKEANTEHPMVKEMFRILPDVKMFDYRTGANWGFIEDRPVILDYGGLRK